MAVHSLRPTAYQLAGLASLIMRRLVIVGAVRERRNPFNAYCICMCSCVTFTHVFKYRKIEREIFGNEKWVDEGGVLRTHVN